MKEIALKRLNDLIKIGVVKKGTKLKYDEGYYIDEDDLQNIFIEINDGYCSARVYLS